MLTCRDASPLIVRESEDALDERGRRELADHLGACASCRDDAAAQREVAALLRARPPLEASPRFAAAIAARLDGEVAWLALAEWRAWTWRLAPVAALLFLFALFAGRSSASVQQASSGTAAQASLGDALSPSTGAPSVFWDENVTGDQVLVTVLTGSRSASMTENRHE